MPAAKIVADFSPLSKTLPAEIPFSLSPSDFSPRPPYKIASSGHHDIKKRRRRKHVIINGHSDA